MHENIGASPFFFFGEKSCFTAWISKSERKSVRNGKGGLDMDERLMVNGSCLTIFLPGEVDHPVSDAIRRESDRIMERTYIKKIVFDFEKTQFMDSSGIGLIMGRYKALGMRNNALSAVHVSSRMEKLLHLSGVHKYVEISGESENHENRGGE